MSSHRIHHPSIRARLALVGRLAALVGTSYFLIASGEYDDPPGGIPASGQACNHLDLKASYRVSGSCGPAGQIVIVSPANECALSVQGAAEVGLPSAGRFDSGGSSGVSLSNGGWSLAGYLPEGAATSTPVSDAGTFTVTSDPNATPSAGPVPHGTLVVRKCQASLGAAKALSLQCRDGSAPACTAVLSSQ
jgi:hypothetical protein